MSAKGSSKLDPHRSEILRLYSEAEVSINELMRRFQVNYRTIRRFLDREGVPVRARTAQWQLERQRRSSMTVFGPANGRRPTLDRAEIWRRLDAGERPAQIARALGCSRMAIGLIRAKGRPGSDR